MSNLLIDRRRIMSSGYTKEGYVSSGLFLHLDGIDQGGVAGYWKSLVGNYLFTPSNAGNVLKTGYINIGNGKYLVSSQQNVSLFEGCTVEVCYKDNGSNTGTYNTLFTNKEYGGVCFAYALSNRAAFCNSSDAQYPGNYGFEKAVLSTKNTISGCSELCVVNKNSVGMVTAYYNGVWNGTNGSVRRLVIGSRVSNASNMYMNADIYSIRLYNRNLTLREMLHNQQVDNIRFGLGLY